MEKADLNGVSIVIYREERARVFAGGGGGEGWQRAIQGLGCDNMGASESNLTRW